MIPLKSKPDDCFQFAPTLKIGTAHSGLKTFHILAFWDFPFFMVSIWLASGALGLKPNKFTGKAMLRQSNTEGHYKVNSLLTPHAP